MDLLCAMKLLGSLFDVTGQTGKSTVYYSFYRRNFYLPKAACGDLDETYINYAEEKTQK